MVSAEELFITRDYKVMSTSEMQPEKPSEEGQPLIQEKYSYNESEDDTSRDYLKTTLDFNIKRTKMTVGIKSFSFHIPF